MVTSKLTLVNRTQVNVNKSDGSVAKLSPPKIKMSLTENLSFSLFQIDNLDTEPLTMLRSSIGQDMELCYRASGSLASPRCSTCCARSGWCCHGGIAHSERSGSESPGCHRFWYNAPIPLRSIWTN